MKPEEYLEVKRQQSAIMEKAEQVISEALEAAHQCPPPKKSRPCKASDIVVGAIIWHTRKAEHGGDFWNVVDEPLHYGDAFKAYVADDGCRYGLHGAYISMD